MGKREKTSEGYDSIWILVLQLWANLERESSISLTYRSWQQALINLPLTMDSLKVDWPSERQAFIFSHISSGLFGSSIIRVPFKIEFIGLILENNDGVPIMAASTISKPKPSKSDGYTNRSAEAQNNGIKSLPTSVLIMILPNEESLSLLLRTAITLEKIQNRF